MKGAIEEVAKYLPDSDCRIAEDDIDDNGECLMVERKSDLQPVFVQILLAACPNRVDTVDALMGISNLTRFSAVLRRQNPCSPLNNRHVVRKLILLCMEHYLKVSTSTDISKNAAAKGKEISEA